MISRSKPYIKILLILIIVFVGVQIFTKPKNFSKVIGTDEKNITKIVLKSGSNGNHVLIMDNPQIQQFINLINGRQYSRSLDQLSNRKGWAYNAEIYKGRILLVSITYTGGNLVYINGTHYNVDKVISIQDMSILFNSLPLIKFQYVPQ